MSVEENKIETPIYGALEEAIDHMKKAYEIMNQQAVDLHKEKETGQYKTRTADCGLRTADWV